MIFREIGASLYAHDLADEGIDHVLDTLHDLCLVNSAYLVALMHHEKRPLTDLYFPHNPNRKIHWMEDSRAYWFPHMEYYKNSKIKPIGSDLDWLKGTDWLQVMIDAARKRKMMTGVELSHTWLDKERGAKEFSHTIQENIYGEKFPQLMCVNCEDVRQYGFALAQDLAANYDIDYIQTCFRFYHQGYVPIVRMRAPAWPAGQEDWKRLLAVVMGGCFCQSCAEKAKAKGLDWDAIKSGIKYWADALTNPSMRQSHEMALLMQGNMTEGRWLLENPELYQWMKFRCDSVTEFFRDMQAAIKAKNPKVQWRWNAYMFNSDVQGVDLKAIAPYIDSIRSSNYSEQSGDPAQMESVKRPMLLGIRRSVGEDKHFVSAIGTRPKATPDLCKRGAIISAETGCDGITIGHWDGAYMKFLRAVKEGMDEAEVQVVQ